MPSPTRRYLTEPEPDAQRVKCDHCDNMILVETYRRTGGICGRCQNERHWEKYRDDEEYRDWVLDLPTLEHIVRLVGELDRAFGFIQRDPRKTTQGIVRDRLGDGHGWQGRTFRFWHLPAPGANELSVDIGVQRTVQGIYRTEVHGERRVLRRFWIRYLPKRIWWAVRRVFAR
jgi:hypothetical protein